MLRWEFAERFGWTLDQIDALALADIHEYVQIQDGRVKAQQKGEKVA